MNNRDFKYQLKKYKRPSDKTTCPSCNRLRKFVHYIDIDTGEDLPHKYGRCDRVDSCGYHLNPFKDGFRSSRSVTFNSSCGDIPVKVAKKTIKRVDIPIDLMYRSLIKGSTNTLKDYFLRLLPSKLVDHLMTDYLIGNHYVWPGAVVFWFVSKDGNIRAGQVKQFDQYGHTVKYVNQFGEKRVRTSWIHKFIREPNTWLRDYEDQGLKCDCLFGEHLMLKYPGKPIALFESPKTAILSAAFFPNFLCLAFGSRDNFTYDRAKVLNGKKVILYPDLSKDSKAFNSWYRKAKEFKSLADFQLSSYLEDTASEDERLRGLDLADYLERLNFESI